MFSWTIDGKNYTAPQGYGEITVAEFAAYWATVAPIKPAKVVVKQNGTGLMAKLAARLNRKAQELRQSEDDLNFDWLKQMEYETAFVQHWLKLPADLVLAMEYTDVKAIHDMLIQSWSAWKPEPNMVAFSYGGKVWQVDFSLDTLTSIPKDTDLQNSLSRLMVCDGKRKRPRYWGGLSLHVGASVMARVAEHQKAIGTIAVHHLIETFKIKA